MRFVLRCLKFWRRCKQEVYRQFLRILPIAELYLNVFFMWGEIMNWYWIVLITLTVYSAIGTILSIWNKGEWLEAWGMGFVGLILWIILYPVRTWRRYSSSINYYKKRNISRLQYMLGKRVKEEDWTVLLWKVMILWKILLNLL